MSEAPSWRGNRPLWLPHKMCRASQPPDDLPITARVSQGGRARTSCRFMVAARYHSSCAPKRRPTSSGDSSRPAVDPGTPDDGGSVAVGGGGTP